MEALVNPCSKGVPGRRCGGRDNPSYFSSRASWGGGGGAAAAAAAPSPPRWPAAFRAASHVDTGIRGGLAGGFSSISLRRRAVILPAFPPCPRYTSSRSSCLPTAHTPLEVDKDASVRKHSLYILKKLLSDSIWMGSDDGPSLEPAITSLATGTHQDNTLSHSGMTKREKWADKEARSMHVGEICTPSVNGLDRWKTFFLLYDMLKEYGTHLVEAAWTHQLGA